MEDGTRSTETTSADNPDHLFQAQEFVRLFGSNDYLDKGVDTHDGKIRLRFGIIDQVQVHQLLQLQVIRLQQQKHISISQYAQCMPFAKYGVKHVADSMWQ